MTVRLAQALITTIPSGTKIARGAASSEDSLGAAGDAVR